MTSQGKVNTRSIENMHQLFSEVFSKEYRYFSLRKKWDRRKVVLEKLMKISNVQSLNDVKLESYEIVIAKYSGNKQDSYVHQIDSEIKRSIVETGKIPVGKEEYALSCIRRIGDDEKLLTHKNEAKLSACINDANTLINGYLLQIPQQSHLKERFHSSTKELEEMAGFMEGAMSNTDRGIKFWERFFSSAGEKMNAVSVSSSVAGQVFSAANILLQNRSKGKYSPTYLESDQLYDSEISEKMLMWFFGTTLLGASIATGGAGAVALASGVVATASWARSQVRVDYLIQHMLELDRKYGDTWETAANNLVDEFIFSRIVDFVICQDRME